MISNGPRALLLAFSLLSLAACGKKEAPEVRTELSEVLPPREGTPQIVLVGIGSEVSVCVEAASRSCATHARR